MERLVQSASIEKNHDIIPQEAAYVICKFVVRDRKLNYIAR